ncbi:mechanosensitive ion channel family protein [Motilibacter deserti]|uniref:mechanosensitive ion channel family protein n=1 Tax=Motilibacter deserti TaxID=2714956 RepID=UPI002F2B4354
MLPLVTTPAPTPSPSSTPTQDIAETLQRCEEGTVCDKVRDWTGERWLGLFADWLLAKPLAIATIVVVAILIRIVLHRLITKLANQAAEGTVPGVIARARKASPFFEGNPLLSERRKQRAQTMGSVLRSVTTGLVAGVAFLMILSEIGLNIAPLLASAGIVGVALGFGAQTLVKDFLSGIFLILEDQYGVGDVVDLGSANGVVEAVGLRVTRVRDVNGAVWYVRNGEILRVGNMSQGWARAVLDVPVAYDSDIERVKTLLGEVAFGLRTDPAFEDLVMEDPEVWGVEQLTADALVVRVVIKTQPLKQWDVARELRQRIKAAFDSEGILPPAARQMWVGAAPAGQPPQEVK